jgi:two-component sensor histidine kinase
VDRIPAIRRVVLAEIPPVQAAAWAVLAVAVPTGLRWFIDQGSAGVPFITYFPAVVLAALMLGWRWAALVALGSGLLANRLFTDEPVLDISALDAVLIGLFALSSAALIWIGEMARRLVRQLEAAKAREELLNAELMHRVKNMLATVNAMAVLTARHSGPGEFAQAFSGRMRALDRATDLLATGRNLHCETQRLVEGAIEPFRTDGNFAISGPRCELPRDACVPLSLALHELCTNAAKHGALTVPEGRVVLTWEYDEAGTVTLDWREEGGPPVSEVRRTGMGTQLLRRQRGLTSVEADFRPDGLRCRITVDDATPLAQVEKAA